MEVLIHFLVAHYREGFAILEFKRLILLQDSLAVSIKLYSQGVNGLDGGDLNEVIMDIAASQVRQV